MSNNVTKNIYINVGEEKNIKPFSALDLGTKAKILLSNNDIMSSGAEKKFRKDCVNFFITAVQHLQKNLPYDVSLLQHAQYVHPEKRNAPEATSAISNLAMKITSVLGNEDCLSKVFGVKDCTKESITDMIRNQWKFYQNEDVQREWYLLEKDEVQSNRKQESYWRHAEELCGIESAPAKRNLKRIDDFWSKIGSLRDEMGSLKYPQLYALMRCVLSLSHGNSTPERGFSINKLILQVHGTSTYETTLTALRFVKDELHRVGGELKFPITRELIKDVSSSHAKYEADRLAKAAAKEAEDRKKKEAEADALAKKAVNVDLEKVEDDISEAKSSISVAEDLITQAQSDLDKALVHKGTVARNHVETAAAKLKVGNERKRKFQDDLCKLFLLPLSYWLKGVVDRLLILENLILCHIRLKSFLLNFLGEEVLPD